MARKSFIPTPANRDVPSIKIASDGKEVPKSIGVVSVLVSHFVNKVASARLILHDGEPSKREFQVSGEQYFAPGKEITISAGYHDQVEVIFQGIVLRHCIKGFRHKRPVLVVECKDKAVKMTVGKKNNYYFDQTDSEILDTVLGQYSDVSGTVEQTTVQHGEMVQYYTCDWDFMLARAEVNGQLVFNKQNEVSIAKPKLSGESALELTYGANLYEFDAELDAENQYGGVDSQSWDLYDFDNNSLDSIEGEAPTLDNELSIAKADLSDVIGLETYHLQHSGKLVDQELQAWADATYLRSKLSQVKGRAKFQGFANVYPGDLVNLDGLNDRFNGKVFISGVRQEITVRNWETEVKFGLDEDWFIDQMPKVGATPTSSLLPGVSGLQTGIVAQLEDDPHAEERVLVRVPLVSAGDDGVWARLATLDAGENRGTFFRPEVGDEVVLGFFNEDPRQPVILGMLHSQAKPSPVPPSDDNHEKGLVTRSEMKLLFDDDKKVITLETPGGIKITMSDDEEELKLEDMHGNIVEMNKEEVHICSMKDLRMEALGDVKITGVNIDVEAQSQVAVKGNSQAELSSSAKTVVNGAIVQIN